MSNFLCEIKGRITNASDQWNIFRRYTNPYEYINTSIPFSNRKCVSKHKHLSRSYFKMIEIVHTFNLFIPFKNSIGISCRLNSPGEQRPIEDLTMGQNPVSNPIKCFFLAEGPGGFCESICNIRSNPADIYVGMTILEDLNDPNIPGWKKSTNFLNKNRNVHIECGEDGTGNILTIENFVYCAKKYASSMDFITADGGFDFSLDFNKQEINIAQLLFGQICFALTTQKKGGCFVLKLFDCFMQHTVDLLYFLSAFYDRVYIFKPNTSRYANSEKYIICKGFIHTNHNDFYPYLYNNFSKMVSATASGTTSTCVDTVIGESYIHRFLSCPISYLFLIKLEEYNAIFGERQIENIQYTLSLIENKYKQEKINALINTNIQKCINWCIKYKLEYNSMSML